MWYQELALNKKEHKQEFKKKHDFLQKSNRCRDDAWLDEDTGMANKVNIQGIILLRQSAQTKNTT